MRNASIVPYYDYDSGHRLGYASYELQELWNSAVEKGLKFIQDPHCSYVRRIMLSGPYENLGSVPDRCSNR